jgi:signal transduction histidine kinase/ligand-binding sensor domain-containing protein
MIKLTTGNKILLLYSMSFFALTSCNSKRDPVPFPLQETEFPQPVTSPLKFSEPKKINWVTRISDSVQPPEVKKIDFDKLPSKPFYPDGFLPLAKPMEESKFDINHLPDTAFNFDNIPAQHLQMQTLLIVPPVIVKAGLPKLRKNAAIAVFEFNEDQGLPGSFISTSTMMQDSHGMMWIATDKGICRFNGEQLEIYSIIDAIFTGVLAGVTKMIEDKQGRIWIKTDLKGIYILDPKAGIVHHFDLPSDAFQVNNDYEMIADSRGLIWIGSITKGVYIIDPQKQTIRNLPHLYGSDNGRAKQILEDSEGNIWIGSLKGLAIINRNASKIHFLNRGGGLPSDTITALFMDTQKRIWVGTAANGTEIVSSKENTIQHLGKVQGIGHLINHLVEDYSGRLWMASDSGVYIFENASQKLKHIDATKGLSDNKIKTIFRDTRDQIWIATFSGINLMDAKGLMPDYLTETDGISGTDVWAFLQDEQQRIWIGSRQGVDIYNPGQHTIKSLAKDVLYKDGRTPQFANAKNGKFLVLAQNWGVDIVDPLSGTVTYIKEAQGVQNTRLSSFLEDNTGLIWTGSFQTQGIEIINTAQHSFTKITKKEGLIGSIVWGMMQDNKGQIWAITDSGINIINPVDKTIRYLMQDDKVSKENGGAILTDDNGRIWIGVRTGILIVDQEKKLLTTINTSNGLCAPDVYTLFKKGEQIYAGTGDGLTVFTPQKNTSSTAKNQFDWDMKSYGKYQGFLYNNYNAGAAIAVNNKLWWGIEDKALTISNAPNIDSSISSTYISGVSIADKQESFADHKWVQHILPANDTIWSIKRDTFYVSENLPADTGWLQKNNIAWDSLAGYFNLPVNLTIPYQQNYISFQFTSARLSNRDKNRYRYILEGFDKSWSAISDKSYSINYRDLPAGKYTFKVCSSGLNGLWSPPAEFSFTIRPPWWNTWWAYLLYAAVFSLVVWVTVQYRSRQLKKENLLLEKKVEHRTEQLNKSLQDLKSTQSQLVQSEKMASLGELTAGIAHEIQNPLNFVNNFSEINTELIEELKNEKLKAQNERDEKLENELLNSLTQNLEKIVHHGKRADAIVKGMLQHSRSSNGQKEPTDISALCDEYLRLSYHGLRAKDKTFNATIKTDFDPTIGNINIIPQDIGRVILNLINNAFYAVSEKKKAADESYLPTVSIQTKRINDEIEIIVSDNGNGIPQKIVDKIFQPFFTTKPTGQGTGLGLSLSYDIVKAHGGELKVETEEGEGSTFIIRFTKTI